MHAITTFRWPAFSFRSSMKLIAGFRRTDTTARALRPVMAFRSDTEQKLQPQDFLLTGPAQFAPCPQTRTTSVSWSKKSGYEMAL